jgi:hypothetical protein
MLWYTNTNAFGKMVDTGVLQVTTMQQAQLCSTLSALSLDRRLPQVWSDPKLPAL